MRYVKYIFLSLVTIFGMRTICLGVPSYADGVPKLVEENTTSTIHLVEGWNLIGANIDPANLENPAIKIVWAYKDGQWRALSSDVDIMKKILENGIGTIDTLDANQGVWVYAKDDTQMQASDQGVGSYGIDHQWRLYGTAKKLQATIFDKACIDVVWKYDANDTQHWKLYSPSANATDKFPSFDTIAETALDIVESVDAVIPLDTA